MATTFPKPGRGAWRTLGGLLPGRPGSSSKVGYYRLATEGEIPIGSPWLRQENCDHHQLVVHLGVKAVQSLSGAVVDGWFGPDTQRSVIGAQTKWGVDADGIVGRTTMRAALQDLVRDVAVSNGVPVEVLGGIIAHESGLDPAAVGVNGVDHGLAQINLSAHPEISLLEALNPDYALHFTAEDLSMVYRTWRGRTTADAWDIAIAHHNSPLLAKRWAIAGTAPEVAGRVFQIGEYVAAVREAW